MATNRTEVVQLEHFTEAEHLSQAQLARHSHDDALEVVGQAETQNIYGPEFSLPPVDTGKRAWSFLAAAFMLEASVWGFPWSYGVFQEYYSTHEPFAGSSNIPVIGTSAMGIMYVTAPIVFGALQRYPLSQRWALPAGLLIMCLSLSLSSFSTTVTQLIATQGVLYAIGGGLAYAPCILYMDGWFVNRKGLAYGVMCAGTGLAGVTHPILMQWLLTQYGYQTALRTWSICLVLLTGPLLYFVQPRVAPSQHSIGKRFDLRWIFTKTFGILQICNIIEALGFFIPAIYLPSYARDLGASSFETALPIILLNVASVFGCVIMGMLIDRVHVTTCIMVSTIGATISALFIWGFWATLPGLYAFSMLYGLFAGSWSSTWTGAMRAVKRKQETADPLMVLAFLSAGRGIGNVASGPLSEALMSAGRFSSAMSGYGSQYGTLIVFTGVTACLGGASIIARPCGWV